MVFTSGTDVSHHQEPTINWQQVFQSGQRFAFIRASYVGTQSKKPNADRNFEKHWAAARKVSGLFLTAYHFFVPVPDVKEQLDFFLNMLAIRKVDLPLVLDFENNGGLDKVAVSTAIESALVYLESRIGYRPIIYTGPSWWNNNTVSSSRWGQHDLWIANYGNPTPKLPRDWSTWRFWQWTESGTISGMPTPIDVNWFNGDQDQLSLYSATSMNSQPSTSTGYRVQVIASMNVRSGPSINHSVVGSLKAGEQLTVLDIAGEDVWLQIAANQWAAYSSGGLQLCMFKAGTPPQIIVTASLMNIRSSPNKTASDVGDLMKNTVLSVSDLAGTDAWVKVGTDRWAAFTKNGQRFMKWLL